MTTEPWADQPLDPDDFDLLRRVAEAYTAIDPPPPNLVAKIEFELTLASLFDDVARLQQVESTFAGARATEQIKTITFSGPDVSLMLTINEAVEGTVRVDGWVAPGAGWKVTVCTPSRAHGELSTSTDPHGRFAFPRIDRALAQFTLHRTDAGGAEHAFTTPLIEL